MQLQYTEFMEQDGPCLSYTSYSQITFSSSHVYLTGIPATLGADRALTGLPATSS